MSLSVLLGLSLLLFFGPTIALSIIEDIPSSISYVLEPFEGSIIDDLVYNSPHLAVGADTGKALFGDQALRVEYFSYASDAEGGPFVLSTKRLPNDRFHNCHGASHVSIWYRHKLAELENGLALTQASEAVQAVEARLVLLDSDGDVWEYHRVLGLKNGDVWQELRMPLDEDAWQLASGIQRGNGELDLNALRGWRFEFRALVADGGGLDSNENNTDDSSSRERAIGTILLDQLSFQGGGKMLGAVLYSSSWDKATESQEIATNYYDSELSRNSTQQVLGSGRFAINYTLQKREDWGGFIQYQHIPPGRAYYNLSTANAISLDYQVLSPASVPLRAHFRIILLDGSNCTEDCGYDGYNLENYYTFHYILDDDSKANRTMTDELMGDDDQSSPFWRSGWVGIVGNNVLERENIKGFKFELSLNSQGDVNSVVSGAIILRNMMAVADLNPSMIPLDTHLEGGLEFSSKNLTQVDVFGLRRCQEACQGNPLCVYGMYQMLNGQCFMSNYVQPQNVRLLNDGLSVSSSRVFWKENSATRGAFCDLCDCRSDERIIDCRDRDLSVVPKIFAQSTWSAQILDLRNNPRLSLLLSGSLKELTAIQEIRLPDNLVYISPDILRNLPNLSKVVVADEAEVRRAPPVNFITSPSGAFSDVCCQPGQPLPLSGSGVEYLAFCELIKDSPGIDSFYEDYVQYLSETNPQVLKPSSPFMSEAAESAQKCAQYCEIQTNCRYFSYDNRFVNSEALCWHSAGPVTGTRLDDIAEHFADPELETPGWISGRVSRTRHEVDNARVEFVSRADLTADASNDYKSTLYITLGSTPLRGAVWVEPRIVSATTQRVELEFSPPRVVLYDNNTVATIEVYVLNVEQLSGDATVVVSYSIQSCDHAFSQSPKEILGQEAEDQIVIDIIITKRLGRGHVSMIALLISLFVVTSLSGIILFYADRKRRQADSVWLIDPTEITFHDPPRILGRGTFGNVVLAEYRGTQVAVKRVIPTRCRKISDEEKQVKLFSQFDGSGEHDFFTSDKQRTMEMGDVDAELGRSSILGWTRRGSLEHCMTGKVHTPLKPIGVRRYSLESASSSDTDNVSKHSCTRMALVQPTNITFSGRGRRAMSNYWEKALQSRRGNFGALKAQFIAEMRHLSRLRHPCITTVMGAVIGRTLEPMLVMEYMDHGSLYDLLHNETMLFNGEHILPVLRDIAKGMRFLHAASPQVIHGDLKAMNILVDSKFRAKVADFGLSQKRRLGAAGTPYWMAPELLRGESGNTTKSDVYSFGMILYEVYSRDDPYEGEVFAEVMQQVADPSINKRPECPAFCPVEIHVMLAECFEGDPSRRPTMEDIDRQLEQLDVASVEPSGTRAHIRRNSGLVNDVFPRHIADALREGKTVEPEVRDMVTIFFCDIVGFTNICSQLDPLKVSDMLDRLYQRFDSLSRAHDVFKVETIGDSWMGVTNLIKDQSDHVKRIADFAADALVASSETLVDPCDPSKGSIQIRIGFHSGPVVGRVVGTRNPRYCLFGDTVNVASRMESTSLPGRIHCSDTSANLLQEQDASAKITARRPIEIKGKGLMQTMWVAVAKPVMVHGNDF